MNALCQAKYSRLKFIGETRTRRTTTLSPFHAESGFLVIFARGNPCRVVKSHVDPCLEIHGRNFARISAPVKFAFSGGTMCIKRPTSSIPAGDSIARSPTPLFATLLLHGVDPSRNFSNESSIIFYVLTRVSKLREITPCFTNC